MKHEGAGAGWCRWLWVAAVVLLAGCSDVKQDLYDLAMQYERQSAGLTTRTVDVNGMSIALLESARVPTGETLVLLHGFGANKDNWTRFASHLTDRFQVVAIDLPGHGQSIKDPGLTYSLEAQVGYVRAILDKLQINRFHLAGNSMGGGISSLYAAAHPGQVASLILFDPAGVFEYKSEFVLAVERGENPLVVSNEADYDRLLDLVLEKRPFIPWPILDVMAQQAVANKALNEKIFADMKAKHLEAEHDFQGQLARVSAPTLILWGREDRVLDYRNADVFERLIPKARKVILEQIGHVPMIEIPEESASLVRDFILSQASAVQPATTAATTAATTTTAADQGM